MKTTKKEESLLLFVSIWGLFKRRSLLSPIYYIDAWWNLSMKRLLWQLYISNIGQIAIKLYCFMPKDNEMFFILKHTFLWDECCCCIFREDVIKHFSNPYRAKFYIDLGQSLFCSSLSTYTLRILRGLPNSSSSFEKLQPPESFLKCLAALASCFSHNSPPCFKANFQTSHTSFQAIASTQ